MFGYVIPPVIKQHSEQGNGGLDFVGPGFHIVFIIVYPAFQKLVFLLILAQRGAEKADHITFCRSGEPEQLLFLIVLR